MNTTIMKLEINTIDLPVFETIAKKFKAKITEKQQIYTPNATTLKAIKQAEQMRKNKDTKFFANSQDLINALND